ncbi:MAG: chloramphenicol acetyltransferase [Clostridia bacterium]|nr:chloramphenicol acetyltransferase [Clostridia bacterium]
MNYTKIDMKTWPRARLFKHYMEAMRIVMSMTVDINVTALTSFARRNNLKFYPCMLWVVTKVINAHDEFKYAFDGEGNLIRLDAVIPSHTDFHPETESFVKMTTEYSEDLLEFHSRVLADREASRDVDGLMQDAPLNCFDASSLPWAHYRSFDLHVFDEGKFLAPVVTWGKYEEECKGTILPLTMNIHHAVCDGFHLSRFFNEVQELVNRFAN